MNTETLDKVVADKGWPHPQLMKLDVQGAECEILKGSPKVLESVEWLIVELQHINYNEGALLLPDWLLAASENESRHGICFRIRPTESTKG